MAQLDTMSGADLQSMTAQNTASSNQTPFGPSPEDYNKYMQDRADKMVLNPAEFTPATAGGEAQSETPQEAV
jgi:hypothetical protein